MIERNELGDSYSRKIDVGNGNNRMTKESEPFVNVCNRIRALVVHCKAVRRVGGYLGIQIGAREIEALCFVSEWCRQFNKEGGPVSKIVGWSGYARNWKKRMNGSIRDCLELGLLEQKPVRGGVRIILSRKGLAVLETVDLMSERVIEEMEGKREKPKRTKS